MNYQTFFTKYNGKKNVGNTTENKGECVGLISMWVEELNLPHIWGHAKDLFVNADEKFFTKFLNTPDFIPQEGDIAVWKANPASSFGHTGIVANANLNTFECFQQNDPAGSACHLKTYNYDYIVGFLRPPQAQDQTTLINELRADRDKNWNLYQQQLQHSITQEDVIAEKQKTIDAITKDNLNLKDQVVDAQQTHSTDVEAIQGLTKENTNLHGSLAKTTTSLELCQKSKVTLTSATKTQLIKELLKRFKL